MQKCMFGYENNIKQIILTQYNLIQQYFCQNILFFFKFILRVYIQHLSEDSYLQLNNFWLC